MKKLIIVILVPVCFSTLAHGQERPVADVAAGYSFLKIGNGFKFNADGGSGSVAVNLNNWLGLASDFALYHAGPIGPGVAAGTYTFGPRLSYRRWNRVTPFAQVLTGGVRYSGNGFVLAAGGGADIGLDAGGKFAIRPQVDYFGFRANGSLTNTVRISIGFVYRFGNGTVH